MLSPACHRSTRHLFVLPDGENRFALWGVPHHNCSTRHSCLHLFLRQSRGTPAEIAGGVPEPIRGGRHPLGSKRFRTNCKKSDQHPASANKPPGGALILRRAAVPDTCVLANRAWNSQSLAASVKVCFIACGGVTRAEVHYIRLYAKRFLQS